MTDFTNSTMPTTHQNRKDAADSLNVCVDSVNNNSIDSNDYLSVNDYDYHLPDELIARYPLSTRSASRLLYLPANLAKQTVIEDKQFFQLPELLQAGDLIVFNDTKVMKARLFGHKPSGGKVEVLIEKILTPNNGQAIYEHLKNNLYTNNNFDHIALCYIRANKSPKPNSTLYLTDNRIEVDVLGRYENLFIVRFYEKILPVLEQYGELPIPPYFERRADETDNTRYQTVFHDPAKLASVAAPTASLHFDAAVLEALNHKGIHTAYVTLHVGAGTFAPVKTDNLLNHTMHSEYAELPQQTADLINQTHDNGNKVIAVGTTVTRVLETAYLKTKDLKTGQPKSADGQRHVAAWSGDTDIFIYPGFEFGMVDTLLTNFHLPKSTLLMLVSAFVGKERIEAAYQHAIEQRYRFFSYGDAMLLEKQL